MYLIINLFLINLFSQIAFIQENIESGLLTLMHKYL